MNAAATRSAAEWKWGKGDDVFIILKLYFSHMFYKTFLQILGSFGI